MPSMASRPVGQVSERQTPAGARQRRGMTPLKEWNGARPVTPSIPKRASGSRVVSSKFGNVESLSKVSRQKQDVSTCVTPDIAGQGPSVNIDNKGFKPQQVAREPASRGNSISMNFRTPSKPDSHGTSIRNSERVSTPAPLKTAVRGQVGHTAASKISSTQCKNLKKGPQKVAEGRCAAGLSILETASYWLTQIKIAEVESKHETAMVFFRLAVDCAAKPFSELSGALRLYTEKHPQTSGNHRETISLYESLGSTISNGSTISAGGHTKSSARPELSSSPHPAESENAEPVASTQEFRSDSMVEAKAGETQIEDTCSPIASSDICADLEKRENEPSHEISEETDTHGSTTRKISSCSQVSRKGRCLDQRDSSVGQLQTSVVQDDSTEGDSKLETNEDATEPDLGDSQSTDVARESALLACDMGLRKEHLAVGVQSVSSMLSTASFGNDGDLKAEIRCSVNTQEGSVAEDKPCNQGHVLYRQAFVTVRDNSEARVEHDDSANPSLITAQRQLVPSHSQLGLRESTIWPEVRGSGERKSTDDPVQVNPERKNGAQSREKRYAENGLELPNPDSPLHLYVGKATAPKDSKIKKGVHFNDVPVILRTPSPRGGQVRVPVSVRSAAKSTPSLLQTRNAGRRRKSKGTPYKVARELETDSTSLEADKQTSVESENHETFEAVKSSLIHSVTQGGASAADSEMTVLPTQVSSIVHVAHQTSIEIGYSIQMEPMVSSFGTERIMSSHEFTPTGQHVPETLQPVAPEMADTQIDDEGAEQDTCSQSGLGLTESSNKYGRRLRRSSSKDKKGTTLPEDATGVSGSIGIMSSGTPGSVRRSARLREAASGEIGRTKVVAASTTPGTRRSARLGTSLEDSDPPTSIQLQPPSPALVTRSRRSRAC